MTTHIIRYRTHATQIEENQRLIRDVFAELARAPLAGVHYQATCTADGEFTHVVSYDEGAGDLTKLPAFQRFQVGIRERCIEPPQRMQVTLVGSFG